MKITKNAKEKTKIKILKSAVEIIISKGYENATLREIAKDAGVSNPTIYNYFPSKERLIYGYIEQKHKESIEILEGIEEFNTYTLREQLQTLIDTELELYLEDREFIVQIADMVFQSNSLKLGKLYQTNELFIEVVEQMLNLAIEANEIEKPPFLEYLPTLFWDYFVIVVAYWLKDDSEEFENTTAFCDHSLGLIESILNSDILSRASDLGMFLFKTHFLSALNSFSAKPKKFTGLKKKLSEVLDG